MSRKETRLILIILAVLISANSSVADQFDLGNYSVTIPFLIWKPVGAKDNIGATDNIVKSDDGIGNTSAVVCLDLMGHGQTGIAIFEGKRFHWIFNESTYEYWFMNTTVAKFDHKNISSDKDIAIMDKQLPFPSVLVLSPATGIKGYASSLSQNAYIMIWTEDDDTTFHTLLDQIKIVPRSEEGKSPLLAITQGL